MLLKEDNKAGDIFHCTLGNLPPQTDARINFSYVIELPQEPDGKIRFTLPTVLNPRYSPGKIFVGLQKNGRIIAWHCPSDHQHSCARHGDGEIIQASLTDS